MFSKLTASVGCTSGVLGDVLIQEQASCQASQSCSLRPRLSLSRRGCSLSGSDSRSSGTVRSREGRLRLVAPQCTTNSTVQQRAVTPATSRPRNGERQTIRLALPSKGRMAEDSLELMKNCQLTVRKVNPRQYIADMPEMKGVEVWFQRASDVVRKLVSGDVDMGIVGYDMVMEYGEGNPDLLIVHEALGFGQCHLAIGVPNNALFAGVETIEDLVAMPEWTAEHPLRVVTGYTHLGPSYFQAKNMKHWVITTADGALEAAPAMGTADVILDLVSSGTTLRENNLRELKGGKVLESQGVLVVSRKALEARKGVLEVTRELLERLEAHMRAKGQFSVTANIRGKSELEIAHKVLKTHFPGLQGPTISPVYTMGEAGETRVEYFAVAIIVPKAKLYEGVQQLRKAGGSGVLVSPLTYIFDEEPPRWKELLNTLGLSKEV